MYHVVAFHFIVAQNLPLIQPDLQAVQLVGQSDPRYAQMETKLGNRACQGKADNVSSIVLLKNGSPLSSVARHVVEGCYELAAWLLLYC